MQNGLPFEWDNIIYHCKQLKSSLFINLDHLDTCIDLFYRNYNIF